MATPVEGREPMTNEPDLVIPWIFAAIDDRRFDDLLDLYAPDVQAHTALGDLSGRDPLVGVLRAVHEPVPVLQHLVTGVLVDLDEEGADVRANVVAFFGDEQHQPMVEGSSIWRGRLRQYGQAWQLASVDIETVWTRGEIPNI